MEHEYDVVVVGAGIGGSALAAQLAPAGIRVLVLEQQESYKDRVRGETIVPWGVREVLRLGLEDVILTGGGGYTTEYVMYDEVVDPASAGSFPVSMIAPDVKGTLNVGHPETCESLSNHAAAVGATVLRGVGDVKVSFGERPAVAFTHAGSPHEATCRLVVGADGRGSTVRRQAGIELEERDPMIYGAGVLVEADAGFDEKNTFGTARDAMFLAFPRTGHLARLYLLVDVAEQRTFTGPGRLDAFLERYRSDAFPESAAFVEGRVAGPCGGAPMTDSWTVGAPVADGVVLIGDAAGWNDPVIGQGLSIALRDARTVADVLLASADWSPAAFDGYVEERAERMKRLMAAARLTTVMRGTFTDEGRARRVRWREQMGSDPTLLMQVGASLVGPENVPGDILTDEALEATFAL